MVDWLESRPYKNLGAEDGSGCGGGLGCSFFGRESREAFRLLLLTLIFLAGLSRDPRELSVSVLYSLFFWYASFASNLSNSWERSVGGGSGSLVGRPGRRF